MNIKEIKEMIALMNENDLMELEIEREGFKIKLKKSGGTIEQTTSPLPNHPKVEKIYPETKPEKPASELSAWEEIKSPMVGTFYRTPSPESAPFVDIGSEVQPGQVICIIEAMKLMNEIKAEKKGIIKEIIVENGHPVEFGQVLFRIEPLP